MEQEKKDKEKAQTGGKKKIVEKSNVVMTIKPRKEKTDMVALEEFVRGIQMEGLDWKASELIPLIGKLNVLKISCNIIDELVSVDDIEELITGNEQMVSSIEINSFTKL